MSNEGPFGSAPVITRFVGGDAEAGVFVSPAHAAIAREQKRSETRTLG